MNRSFLLVVAGLVAVVLGVRMFLSAGDQAVSTSGAPLVAVSVPQLDETAREGEVIFDASCAECHGDNAAGRDGAGPPLVHIIYEPNHHGDAAFYLAVMNGVRAHHWQFGDMAPVDGVNEDEVTKIIAYVRALQRANGIN